MLEIDTESERNIDVTIRRLRVKLGSAGAVIKTAHGFGYRLDTAA